MSSTRSSNSSSIIDEEEENRLIEEIAMLSTTGGGGEEDEDDGNKRRSRASVDFFQRETSKHAASPAAAAEVVVTGGGGGRRRSSFLGQDGKVQDKYIAKRASLNKPDKSIEHQVPNMADLTKAETITRIDGPILSQMLISGYAKLDSMVAELNRINVYPIADGDTGSNMKVCLKLPARNLMLDPSESILRVASNMAADVLLNGQGNSGTILSHFFVSLAEEIGDTNERDSLSINQFARCLSKAGERMQDAVPNPQEGTIISVCRDSCVKLPLWSYLNLKELLQVWNDSARNELRKTPDQLIVDGLKVLEKAGVVDSGAQGFAYMVEGMLLASEGKLPEVADPNLFKTGVKTGDYVADLATIDDHNVCDTKYQFCTEAVILLKDGCTKQDVFDMIDTECDGVFGDSVVCVGAPAKEGGNMCKIHIHTDEPQRFFDKLLPFSRSPIYKKEKVEDMKIMRDLEHVEGKSLDLSQAKFTILGSKMMLPSPEKNSEDIYAFPMFLVPEDTGEPIDLRFVTDTEALIAYNRQRNESTAIKYTTATSNPMQMKIELLSAIAKGKPVLVFISTLNKNVSAMGRNLLEAIDMLDPEEKNSVKLYVTGINDNVLIMEAIKCAKEGKDIDETVAICEDIANRTLQTLSFHSSKERKNLKAWRPALFPDEIIDGTYKVSGTSGSVSKDGRPVDKRIMLSMTERKMADSLSDAYEFAVKYIKEGLEPGQKIGTLLIPCIGRPDNGNNVLKMIEEAGIEIVGTPRVFSIFIPMCEWGSLSLQYKIIE